MKRLLQKYYLVLLALFQLFCFACAKEETEDDEPEEKTSSANGACGTERWSIKVGSDADVKLIHLNETTETDIKTLISFEYPTSLPEDKRIQPTELTVYSLNATLTKYKLEKDGDYHLVLSDVDGNTMIAEIPSLTCVEQTSPLYSAIQSVHKIFDAKFKVSDSFKSVKIPIKIKGIGFFDFKHGQTGVAPNAIELHPVTDVQF